MLHHSLINPKSIVVVGGSDNISSPGGRVLKNLIDHNFKGELNVVNPKKEEVQGITCKELNQLPSVELAIIAIPAHLILETVKVLTETKQTKGFIIFSAGFSETNEEGANLETAITEQIAKFGGSLLGPNNIGVLNTNFAGVFTSPIPKLDVKGVDLVSGSGATAVFIMEAANQIGLTFSSVFTLGNSAQIGVEEILEYFDLSYDENESSRVKMLYVESIKKPKKFLKHARSLVEKGCKITAIKAGTSDAGKRAASSHTGALASSDLFIEALFKKAGIIRCFGRQELIYTAGVLSNKQAGGSNFGIITHAGGPAVMLTDVLSKNGLHIPQIDKDHQEKILKELFNGSTADNPIDIMATGTEDQLEFVIEYCDNHIPDIDVMVVIFGSPGLRSIRDAFKVISNKARSCDKPVYAVLPSVVNTKDEIIDFIDGNNIAYSDEVILGSALANVYNTKKIENKIDSFELEKKSELRQLIDKANDGYLSPNLARELLLLSEIPFVDQHSVSSETDILELTDELHFPVAMKVVGPLHKSDVGGVQLNIKNGDDLLTAFNEMMGINDAVSVIIQPMHKGLEIFIGAKKETNFPHIVMCGLGGIYIEAFKDVSSCLIPVSKIESNEMITNLKSYSILKGIRGQKGININEFSKIIRKVSALLHLVPEIAELDINPLMASQNNIVAVDVRIRIEK